MLCDIKLRVAKTFVPAYPLVFDTMTVPNVSIRHGEAVGHIRLELTMGQVRLYKCVDWRGAVQWLYSMRYSIWCHVQFRSDSARAGDLGQQHHDLMDTIDLHVTIVRGSSQFTSSLNLLSCSKVAV